MTKECDYMGKAILAAIVTLIVGYLGTVVGVELLGNWYEFGLLIAIAVMGAFIIYFNEQEVRQLQVCRTDKIPLGTKGRTSILSYREYRASCGASFSVSRRKLHDRECCVTSFRQGGYTPLRRLCGYPLWTCRPQTVLTNRLPPASLKIRHKQILRMV